VHIKNRVQLIDAIESLIREKGPTVNLNHLDVSTVKYFDEVFSGAGGGGIVKTFNGDISKWDVSKGESFRRMFYGSAFNGNVSQWDTSSAQDMTEMFYGSGFNQPIGSWDVSSVDSFAWMFGGTSFNQNLSRWDIKSAMNMDYMFKGSAFNNQGGSLESWKPIHLVSAVGMFEGSKFNQRLSPELFQNLEKASRMFRWTQYDQSLGRVKVPRLKEASEMFCQSQASDLPGGWDVEYLTKHPNSVSNLFDETPFLEQQNFSGLANLKKSVGRFGLSATNDSGFNEIILPEWLSRLTEKHLQEKWSEEESAKPTARPRL